MDLIDTICNQTQALYTMLTPEGAHEYAYSIAVFRDLFRRALTNDQQKTYMDLINHLSKNYIYFGDKVLFILSTFFSTMLDELTNKSSVMVDVSNYFVTNLFNHQNYTKFVPVFFGYKHNTIEDRNKFYHYWSQQKKLKIYSTLATAKSKIYNGGGATAGYLAYLKDPTEKVGIMIAGNSGRPGGSISAKPPDYIYTDQLRVTHKTQEEDMVSNWLLTFQHIGDNIAYATPKDLFKNTIHGKWGMKDPSGTDGATIQGIDYRTTTNAEDYSFAWVLEHTVLSKKNQSSIPADIITPEALAAYESERYFDSLSYDYTLMFPATLVWVAGPNAGATGSFDSSSTTRTLNTKATNDWPFFRECVKWALRAGLDAMIAREITVALVAQVSSGIYAGNHKDKIRSEFQAIVNEVLNEPVCNKSGAKNRGFYFKDVIIPKIMDRDEIPTEEPVPSEETIPVAETVIPVKETVPIKPEIIPSVFRGRNKPGDFDWMIRQPTFSDALFIFNDNPSDHYTNKKGGGNAVIRPYNQYGKYRRYPRSAGISTGPNYSSLTPKIKAQIDSDVDEIKQLIPRYKYKRIYWSATDTTGNDLGTGIFTVAPEVRAYIVKKIKQLGV